MRLYHFIFCFVLDSIFHFQETKSKNRYTRILALSRSSFFVQSTQQVIDLGKPNIVLARQNSPFEVGMNDTEGKVKQREEKMSLKKEELERLKN